MIGFRFNTPIIDKIVVRSKTYTEIYAELGGIYAASLAILMMIFSKSGHLDKKGGKEMYIFAFLPDSWRKKWLTGKEAKDESTTDKAAPV